MAIILLNEPTEFYPIYHPSIFRLNSTNKNQLNFKYTFKLEINAVIQRKIKVSPDPVNGFGYFDVRTHLLDFLNQDVFDITDANFQDAAKVEYIIKVDEEYDDGAGNHIVNVDAKIFTEKIGFNTRLNRNAFFGDLTKLQIGTAFPGEMLININPFTTIFQDDIFFVHFAGKNTAPFRPHKLEILELDRSGNLLATTLVAGDLVTNSQLVTMDLSAIVFNALTYFIEFSIIDIDTNFVTDVIRLLIKPRPCSEHTPIKLIYLDSKGSFNSLNFDGVSKQDFKTKVKTFRKFVDPISETETSRGVQRFFQDTEEKFEINTLLTTEESNIMFDDFMRSDRVFIDLRNNAEFSNVDFFPVEVLTKSFKPVKLETNEIPQYSINIRFAFEQIDR